MDYKSSIILGNRYRDKQTQVEGVAVCIEFHQHMCERVVVEAVKDSDIKQWVFDAVRLEPVGEPDKEYVQPTSGGLTASRPVGR